MAHTHNFHAMALPLWLVSSLTNATADTVGAQVARPRIFGLFARSRRPQHADDGAAVKDFEKLFLKIGAIIFVVHLRMHWPLGPKKAHKIWAQKSELYILRVIAFSLKVTIG